jgi:hypothetical protein
MFFLDGKEVLQMDVYIIMHADTALHFLWEHTFWLMPGFRHVLVSLYLSNNMLSPQRVGQST